MPCDFGTHLAVCTITDESLAASFRVSLEAVRARLAHRARRKARRRDRMKRWREAAIRRGQRMERDKAIGALKGRSTLRATAKAFGISYERVRQIWNQEE